MSDVTYPQRMDWQTVDEDGNVVIEDRVWVSCPGCGDSDTAIEEIKAFKTPTVAGHLDSVSVYRGQCQCGWSGPWRTTPDDARKAWNTRAVVETKWADSTLDSEDPYEPDAERRPLHPVDAAILGGDPSL